MEKKNLKKLLLKITVSIVLLYILFVSLDWSVFFAKIRAMDFKFVPIIIFFIVLNYIISSIRWKQLLVFENSKNVSIIELIRLYFVGSFFNNFMPTSIGGDVYKVFKLGKKINNNAQAFAATFTERFLGVVVLIVFSIVGFVLQYGLKWLGAAIIGVLIGTLIFNYSYKHLRKIKFVYQVFEALHTYKNYPKVIKIGVITSIGVQLLAVLTQYLIFLALSYEPPLLFSLIVLPLITLASFFIPSLNGIGVQDALFVTFFAQVGIPSEVSLVASVSYHFFRLMVSLIGGVLYATEYEN